MYGLGMMSLVLTELRKTQQCNGGSSIPSQNVSTLFMHISNLHSAECILKLRHFAGFQARVALLMAQNILMVT